MDDDAFGCIFVLLMVAVVIVGIIDPSLLWRLILIVSLFGVWTLPILLGVGVVIAIIAAIFKN